MSGEGTYSTTPRPGFVKLTAMNDNQPIFVQASKIMAVHHHEAGGFVALGEGGSSGLLVQETPEQILKAIGAIVSIP